MWRKWLLLTAAFALSTAMAAGTQDEKTPKPQPDEKFRPEAPREGDDDDLTPEKAMALLKEAKGLMAKSEELLNDSSRGKALETEEELVAKLKELLKEEAKSDPTVLQKQILEKIEKLMGKSEGSQKDAIERMNEIIRKAKS